MPRVKFNTEEERILGQKARMKRYYEKHKATILNKAKSHYLLKKDKICSTNKKYRDANKEQLAIKAKVYNEQNKEKIIKRKRIYRKLNSIKISEYKSKYYKARLKSDPLFRLTKNIRNSINNAFYNNSVKKNGKTAQILGCSFSEFKNYIEAKFESWMTWENQSKWNGELNFGWDIDHIIPISSAKTEEEILKLNHYTNFKPLCSHYNRYIKRNKF